MSNAKKVKVASVFIEALLMLVAVIFIYAYTRSASHQHKLWSETVSLDLLVLALFLLFEWRYFRFIRNALARRKKLELGQGKTTDIEEATLQALKKRAVLRLGLALSCMILAIISYYVIGYTEKPA